MCEKTVDVDRIPVLYLFHHAVNHDVGAGATNTSTKGRVKRRDDITITMNYNMLFLLIVFVDRCFEKMLIMATSRVWYYLQVHIKICYLTMAHYRAL